jgi:hypothetical protein
MDRASALKYRGGGGRPVLVSGPSSRLQKRYKTISPIIATLCIAAIGRTQARNCGQVAAVDCMQFN